MEEKVEIRKNAQKFLNIRHVLEGEFDLSKLPKTAEVKYDNRQSGGSYGHVILKIERTPLSDYPWGADLYSFKWAVKDEIIPQEEYFNYIVPIIKDFFLVLSLLNNNEMPLAVSLIGGSYKLVERAIYFRTATFMAMEELLTKLVISQED
ncbi:MAG: hypothetical protein EOP53_14020 [Sphingobacteriales bacterium]|nr:MAG: hypothetical protein EOP53_14020 [Sphingobacteriales bacterium]